MNQSYIELAYEREIMRYLKKYLIERCLPEGGVPARESLVCDDLPFSIRDIPPDALLGVVQRLAQTERELDSEIEKFSHIQNVVRPLALASKKEDDRPSQTRATGETNDADQSKPGRKTRRAKPGGSGGASGPARNTG